MTCLKRQKLGLLQSTDTQSGSAFVSPRMPGTADSSEFLPHKSNEADKIALTSFSKGALFCDNDVKDELVPLEWTQD